jgi:hypothetical protein
MPMRLRTAFGDRGRACGRRGADERFGFPLGRRGPTCDDFRTTHVEPDQTAWIRTRGKVDSTVRMIRGKSSWKRS